LRWAITSLSSAAAVAVLVDAAFPKPPISRRNSSRWVPNAPLTKFCWRTGEIRTIIPVA
jgi:hypothetical protein